MAFSAHSDPSQVVEHFATDAEVDEQAKRLAEMIRSSEHFVAFTGAGVSTSAGIPDFRGPNGVWTRRAQGKQAPRGTNSLQAMPTPTHMALVALEKAGRLRLLVSQNCDGLHRRSGFPPAKLAELHGNGCLERCRDCGAQFLRDFHVRNSAGVHEHLTGRQCLVCNGRLRDTIVNFGESLPREPLRLGFEHAQAADLMLCLGSSLTVTPAADIPVAAAERGAKLVVCNLQKTPLDKLCSLRAFTTTDALMTRVCRHLELPLPPWRLRRFLRIRADPKDNQAVLTLKCYDSDDTPSTFLAGLRVSPDGGETKVFKDAQCAKNFEFRALLPRLPCRVAMTMAFMRHYNEPDFQLQFEAENPGRFSERPLELQFDPLEGKWLSNAAECEGSGCQ